MKRDKERIARIEAVLTTAGLDAVICTLPTNVLLVSGYWPVIGNSVVIATRNGKIILVVPKDEESLAQSGWADEIWTFTCGSLEEIKNTTDCIREPLLNIATKLGLFNGGSVGYEHSAGSQPSTYAASHRFPHDLSDLLGQIFYGAKLTPADELLSQLRSTLTAVEVERLRVACKTAETAFLKGGKKLRAGLTETAAASFFHAPLTKLNKNVQRAGGFVYCMSGENGFEAFAAYQRSRSRKIQDGDLVLIHCNSYVDGFWTDITRTYCIGEPDEQKQRMYNAVLAARAAAIAAVGPGVNGATVDRAARDVMNKHRFGKEFRHATGHGVGFVAINHDAVPRIHPKSPDILKVGMIFNIEPGVYIENFGGMRHCDMVLVTDNGAEVLTPFQSSLEDLVVIKRERALAR